MRRSPLSTPRDEQRNHGNRSGRRRGYNYSRAEDEANYQFIQAMGIHAANRGDGNMIPLDTSSPIDQNEVRRFFHNRQTNFRQSEEPSPHYSFTEITGNRQRVYTRRMAYKPKAPSPEYDPYWYRHMPISRMTNLKQLFDNPWAELEKKMERNRNEIRNISNDSSVEVILEKNGPGDRSGSISDTINISSSCDEVKEGSSIELPLENMSFSSNPKHISDNNESRGEKSVNESIIQSESDSVIEITH